MKKIYILLSLLFVAVILTSCAGVYGGYYYCPNAIWDGHVEENNNRYEEINEFNFIDASKNSNAYLSLDNSSYSYTNLRNYIEYGYDITKDVVHIEEMLNYFSYGYETHDGLNIKAEAYTCPWNSENVLETVSLYAPLTGERKPSNLTFLVDCSGSMSGDTRLGLFKKAFEACLPYFTKDDKVSIVTYASGCRTIIDGVIGTNTDKILNAVNSLNAYGSTYGEAGIQKAYSVAQKNFIKDGNNHIFIVTDGDFNVGINNTEDLKAYVSEYVSSGIYLSVFGVGNGNTRQSMIEAIAKSGNGNAFYLDSLKEATNAFQLAFTGGVNILTRDTKASVYFNPDYVDSYRIIGYETKVLTEEEYEDDTTDAGEIFEGYEVMAVFEVKLKENVDTSFSTIEIKYKDPSTLENKVMNQEVVFNNSVQHEFASCVTEFGLLLYGSEYKGEASFENIIKRLEKINDYIAQDEKKLELLELVRKASER